MSSCLSFILVGKSASIIDIYDWSTRHALTFYIAFSIICIITVKSGLDKIQLKTATIMVGNYYKIFPNRSTFYFMNRIVDRKERSFQLKRLEE